MRRITAPMEISFLYWRGTLAGRVFFLNSGITFNFLSFLRSGKSARAPTDILLI